MTQEKVYLASDNNAPVHPQIMEAIMTANQGYAAAYGTDQWTDQAKTLIQKTFAKACKILFVPTGTASNVLAFKLACRRYESVICSDIAHVHYQESGAAESVVGCKLLVVPQLEGKISIDGIKQKLKTERAFGHHSTSPRVVSLTQPTEVGTVYSLDELKAISRLCTEEKLLLHIDGSRLYNALVHLGVTFDEFLGEIPIDFLSLGGTKNGLMCAELLAIFNPDFHAGADTIHKQTLQLLSKMRFLAAQYITYFENGLWHSLAAHANQKAQEIAAIIQEKPQLSLHQTVQSNQVFFSAPSSWIPRIQEKIACHLWNEEKRELRFISSWTTSDADVEQVRALLSNSDRFL